MRNLREKARMKQKSLDLNTVVGMMQLIINFIAKIFDGYFRRSPCAGPSADGRNVNVCHANSQLYRSRVL